MRDNAVRFLMSIRQSQYDAVSRQPQATHFTGCLKNKHTKLSKSNLKLIMLINNILLFLDFTQRNLNFESSFVGIHQILREIWLFEHEFQS